jgi:alpha-tubulin suppressor-like RCC1 family protein
MAPQKVPFDDPSDPFSVGPVKLTAIDAGDEFSLALDSLGRVWGWGSNENSQLSAWRPSTFTQGMPIMIDLVPTVFPGSGKATAIAAGGAHAHAIVETGTNPNFEYTVYGWGENVSGVIDPIEYGGSGVRRVVPFPHVLELPSSSGVVTGITAGDEHAHVLVRGSAAGQTGFWTYGDNSHGQ